MPEASPDEIAKAVLRSQPPHSDDVPDMVAFNAKWGGGAGGYWVKDIIHYCTLKKVAPDVHVPGRIFAALAKLDFGTEMPAQAVAAILKRVAVSTKIIDGVASDVKVTEIAALSKNKEKTAKFLEANKVMKNCLEILKSKNISDPQKTLDGGWLQINIINFLMGKPDDEGNQWQSLESVTKAFLNRLFADDADVDVEPTATSGSSANVVQYEDGVAVDVPKMALLKKGFKEGSKYILKDTKEETKDTYNTKKPVYKLVSIAGDGTCTLHEHDDFGQLMAEKIVVQGNVFASTYRPFEKSFKFLAEYKGTEPKDQQDLLKEVLNNRVKDCLLTLACEMKDYPIAIRTSPSKGVFCKEDISDMVLCPYGHVTMYDPVVKKAKPPEVKNSVVVEGPWAGSTTKMFIMSTMSMDDKSQNAFWAVQTTSNETDVNMEIFFQEVRYLQPTVQAKLKISGHEFVVKVPCLKNVKPLTKGSELLMFKAKNAETAKKDNKVDKPLKLDLAPAAKRAKKS